MNEILNQLGTVALGLGILGGSYLVWLLSGIANVTFTKGRKWSFKRMFEDLAKAFLMSVAILSWVVIFNAIDWFALQMGADISALLDGASVTGLIGGIIGGTVYFIGKGYKNFYEFINTNHTQITLEKEQQNYQAIAEKIYDLFETPTEVVEYQKEFEEKEETLEGGKGVYYNVAIDDYVTFKKAVLNRGFDLDGAHAFQCWDGACLIWQQLGRWLETGDGSARGCWNLKRTQNAGNDFELITNKNDIKIGDILVFSCGKYGHIGYADEDYNGGTYIKLLGQNQGGDMKFCVINMSMSTFIGAFRLKKWNVVKQSTPAKKTQENALKSEITYVYKQGDTFGQVICNLGLKTSHGLWGNDGDVAFYTEQLHAQGIYGNIPVGAEIKLTRR